MKTKKKKILVLSGLKQDLESVIKSASSLAQIIDGHIDVLYVKKPTEIVDTDSQLSAIRHINREHIVAQNTMNEAINPYAAKYGIAIKGKFAIGNVKDTIRQYIDKTSPDIIILGKRKYSPFKLKDDAITDFILNTFNGPVLISPPAAGLEPEKELSIGVLKGKKASDQEASIKDLINGINKPMKSFTVVSQAERLEMMSSNTEGNPNEYIFEKNDNTVNSLSNYLTKSKVNLLYLERNKLGKMVGSNLLSSKDIINKVNVPLLFGGWPELN